MPIKHTLKLLFLFSCILLYSCTKTDTVQVNINTDLTKYGLDSLKVRTMTPIQIDSVANLVHQNIKQDYLNYKKSDNESEKSDLRKEEYFGDKLYGFYLHFPESDNSTENLKRAFAIWYVSDAVNKMELALNRISINESYWGELANYYNLSKINAKNRSWLSFINSRDHKNHIQKLVEWSKDANSNVTRTHLSFYIAKSYFVQQEYDRANEYLLKVFELNRDSVLVGCQTIVDKARSYYNEIHSLQIGDKAPSFSTTLISGESIDLSEFREKVILLEFWSTSCGPCIKELPNLKDLYASFKDRDDFIMVGISLDTDIERVKSFVSEHNIDWYQIFDDGYGEVSQLYNSVYLPRTYLIDRNGNIAHKDLREKYLKEAVASMLID
ncbi:MAG: TlpA family protein disulfide reductase [Balneolaceae bacterium]|nr:TlpA family protein disulfide reductase [Balneolaceae bacterium]